MACDIVSGFSLGCLDNTGGIRNAYLLSGSITGLTGAPTGLLTEITGNGTFYKFEQVKETADFIETINPSEANGTVFYTPTVNLVFHKVQSSLRNQVRVLAKNPNLKMIIETNNGTEDGVGKYFLLGYHNGMFLTSGQAASGKAFGDMSGYTLSFVGKEPVPFYELDGELTDVLSGITVG